MGKNAIFRQTVSHVRRGINGRLVPEHHAGHVRASTEIHQSICHEICNRFNIQSYSNRVYVEIVLKFYSIKIDLK